MDQAADTDSWLKKVVDQSEGYESEAVARFANRLVMQARAELPQYLRSRIDPEDVIQSVFHSFFKKHKQNQFEFSAASDVWKLLSAMTYRKVANKIRFHHRSRRDVGREREIDAKALAAASDQAASGSAITIMIELLQGILERLSPLHQQILLMRMNDHTIEEISAQVHVSSRTVNRALLRVRTICNQLKIDSPSG